VGSGLATAANHKGYRVIDRWVGGWMDGRMDGWKGISVDIAKYYPLLNADISSKIIFSFVFKYPVGKSL
jgi:hypothetical protein